MFQLVSITLIEPNDIFRISFEKTLNNHKGIKVQVSVPDLYVNDYEEIVKSDLIIFGMSKNKKSNFSILKELQSTFPDIGKIVLAEDIKLWQHCLFSRIYGMNGFYLKSSVELEELLEGIISVQHPNSVGFLIQKSFKETLLGGLLINTSFPELTFREKEVIYQILQEKQNIEIAEDLGLSIRTIETRRRNILYKTGYSTMTGVIVHFLNSGVLFSD